MVILNCLKELEGMGWCEGFEGCEGCERSYEMVVCDWGMQLKTSTEPIPAFSIYSKHLIGYTVWFSQSEVVLHPNSFQCF